MIAGNAKEAPGSLKVVVEAQFEQCLELRWDTEGQGFDEYVVEMVLDRARRNDSTPVEPAKDAMVKTVEMGSDSRGCIQNMPSGRNFLISVVGKNRRPKFQMRSPWIRCGTLSPADRDKDLGNRGPDNEPRVNCLSCTCCPQYVPFRFALNLNKDSLRCRSCGCTYSDHAPLKVKDILKARETKFQDKVIVSLRKKSVTPLPDEALDWDNRECALWFWTDGHFHPREELQKTRTQKRAAALGGAQANGGIKGRVSVATPTTDSRHEFHEALWRCFEAQSWQDKELVVVETYSRAPSPFFTRLAEKEPRLVYVAIQRQKGQDWSIGLKRNLATHLASGEFIANFDDDDFYAPEYLSTMLAFLEDQNKYAVTLSSWFIYDQATDKWGFCDPIAWGLAKGMDISAKEVKEKAYGYGFSYVFRRKAGLDLTYEDINLGEDFFFFSQLQTKRGNDSIALFHDDFGVCLHVQHGGNTSNSILLRDVLREEWCSLDIMELAPRFTEEDGLAASIFTADPPSQRQRWVCVHLPTEDIHISCAINVSVADFLECIKRKAGHDCQGMCVYRVPPLDQADEATQDAVAIEVLGLRFLAEMPGAEHNISPDSACGKQWRRLLAQARCPMLEWDRIGLRTQELWLRPSEAPREQQAVHEHEAQEEFLLVRATLQKSDVKKFFSTQGAVLVRVPAGATVGALRTTIGRHLPPTAKVMKETEREGLVFLKDEDTVPASVVLSDFGKGQRQLSYYTRFTPRENRTAMKILKAFLMRPEVQARMAEMEQEVQGDHRRHSLVLCEMLGKEAYPPILRYFGIPEDHNPLGTCMHCMSLMHEDWEATRLWLETEILMRNQVKLHESYNTLRGHYHSHEVEAPSLEEIAHSIW